MIGDLFMETAIYVRVSTEEQAQEGFSIRAQQQKLKDYARVKDWSIYDIYIDEGISGKNIEERPAVTQMIADIQAGHVQNVVVFKIDRLTRSTADLAYLIDLFNKYNCAFNSLMESIDTQTASGRMFIKIIGIFAEFERENIAERVRLGFERRAKEGYTTATRHTSYGYSRENGQKIQTINEEEASIIREIFDMYVNQNMSLFAIAKLLNVRQVPTRRNTTWKGMSVSNVLKNCNYIGKVRYAIVDEERNFEIEGLHEAIIEVDLFEKAQKLLAKNKGITKTKKPKTENYYLGFLRCPKCGSKLTTHGAYKNLPDGTKKYFCYYKCIYQTSCDFGTIAHSKLESAFQKYMSNISDFKATDEIQLEQQQEAKQKILDLLQTYSDKLRQLKSKENEVLSLYVDGHVDFKEYRNVKKKIDKESAGIQAEIDKLSIPNEEASPINQEDIILEFNENWKHLTDSERRKFLLSFVKKISISTKKAPNNFHWIIAVENVEFA